MSVRRTSSAVRRRRLLAAGALVAVTAGALAVAAGTLSGDHGSKPRASRPAAAAATPAPPRPIELPRGGREIFPHFRVVAYYGAPQAAQLGELGIGTPTRAGRKLEHQAKPYARRSRPVLPAMELIAVIANGSPGPGGRYSTRQSDAVIRRYLKAARKIKALLVLDIQPGRSDFFTETIRLRKWLKQPDVGLALDPEWRVQAPQVPAQVIGHVGSREVNATTAWLDQLTAREKLPQKLVIIHQFTDDMLPEAKLKHRAHLAMVLNADGFGSEDVKVAKYKRFVRQAPSFRRGFKLFYHEDVHTMSPAQVMRLRPRPDVLVYE